MMLGLAGVAAETDIRDRLPMLRRGVAAAIVDCDVPDDFLARVRGG